MDCDTVYGTLLFEMIMAAENMTDSAFDEESKDLIMVDKRILGVHMGYVAQCRRMVHENRPDIVALNSIISIFQLFTRKLCVRGIEEQYRYGADRVYGIERPD